MIKSAKLYVSSLVTCLVLLLASAGLFASESNSDTGLPADSIVSRVIAVAGFPSDETSVRRAREGARLVSLHFPSRGKSLDTTVYNAWQLTFHNVPLKWLDGEIYFRDYSVLVDCNKGGLLLIKSPAVSETDVFDSRESQRSGHPNFDANAAMVADTTLISFAQALLSCRNANPLKGKTLEASVIVYNSMWTDSVLAWDIVARGDIEYLSPFARHYVPPVSEEAAQILREKMKNDTVRQSVREFINAKTGRSLGGVVE